ncbi:Lysine-specific demethylase JMJ703 [Vitis vinifera]|uniref:Lysine-specific demethylase JMJ703 n=1 Tax=Vitis vinifera TaxID=29760 RepID=A0A438BZP7_VITVI|nr:Lysine-specific demethylase JMJ703 [Vitis vinifera]
MGKGRPRAVEKGVLGQSSSVSLSGSLSIPPGPVYYPSEDEFKDPLEYIYRIRPEAEPYGICRIVPPKSWKPPFGLDLDSFTFPTKTQAIHQLQARPAACDSKTFDLEYNRFLDNHCGKKSKKRVVFEGEELDLCRLFNAAKRFGGYDKVVKEKKWGRSCKRGMHGEKKGEHGVESLSSKRRRRNTDGEKVKVCKVEEKEESLIRYVNNVKVACMGKIALVFVPGKRFSLEAFRRVADRAKRKWFGSVSPSRMQIEKKFWEIVEGLVGEVEVIYGSDLDTSVYGSGFPRVNDKKPESVEDEIWDKYCASPWNLNNLPKLQGSMLRAVHHNIAGVMVPWLYVGMLFSSFCWHFEDHCFYSMNYLHWYV